MSSLSKDQKDLILDFYFRCGEDDKIDAGRDLVAANPDAALLYAQLEDTLTQLDNVKYEPCPENLVELTVARLKLASSSGHTQLHKLLELEQQKQSELARTADRSQKQPVRLAWGWRDSLVKITSMAAMILIVASIAVPTVSNMRQRAWRTLCESRLGRVAVGMMNYADDNDGSMPYVASATGALWSKTGYQGKENESNNRNPFLLYKLGYVGAEDFTCPGNKHASPLNCTPEELKALCDFESRDNFNFSFRIMCPKASKRIGDRTFILMSDITPVFEKALSDRHGRTRSGAVRLKLDEKLLKRMSSNHREKGQNILSSDGSVRFIKVRIINEDDIFTISNIRYYEGREVPCEESDTFLAP